MTANDLKTSLELEVINEADSTRIITNGYCCDLLSWVMGRAKSDDVWVTIMTNLNVIAVASLSDISCVLISEDSELNGEFISAAEKNGVNVYRSKKNSFELCGLINSLLNVERKNGLI